MEGLQKLTTEKRGAGQTESPKAEVPIQFRGMTAEAVDIAWTVPVYLDPEKTAAELQRKELALEHLRRQEVIATAGEIDLDSETQSVENLSEGEAGIEQFLEQPNVQAAQAKLQEMLGGDIDVNTEGVKSLLYELLTKRSWLFDELQRRGSKDLAWMIEEYRPHREWYRTTLEQLESQFTTAGVEIASNPAWFSVTASKRSQEQAESARYKVYETLDVKDYSKISELPKLIEKLKAIGAETQESIKLKIPGNFSGFITHNDSIVIHCDSADTCLKAQAAVKEWESEQQLAPAERELGRTTIAVDGKTEFSNAEHESFSELVATQIATWIDEHKDNYPADMIASEAIKHTISLAQRTPAVRA